MMSISCATKGEHQLVPLSCTICVSLAFLFTTVPATGQRSDPNIVTVASRQAAPQLVAYGQVAPISMIPVSAAEAGLVTSLQVRPGSLVRVGQSLAHLSGPTINSSVVQGEADVHSAQSQLVAAETSLAIARQQLPMHLTTRQAVQQAESSVAQLRSVLVNAQSRLTTVRQLMTVSAPEDGTVLQLNSANGALVVAGQPIVTIQPANGLWLVAMYYGTDLAAIHVGMKGEFLPSEGGRTVKIKVVSIPGVLAAGGGEAIALEPLDPHASWLSGESGTVMLELSVRPTVAVPTRALVLNQGKWFVMVHTASGDRAQEVVPGPAQGWETLIVSGLDPGTKIVVNNAYLLFHSKVTEQYQIPD